MKKIIVIFMLIFIGLASSVTYAYTETDDDPSNEDTFEEEVIPAAFIQDVESELIPKSCT